VSSQTLEGNLAGWALDSDISSSVISKLTARRRAAMISLLVQPIANEESANEFIRSLIGLGESVV
jgi:hypothetical protein